MVKVSVKHICQNAFRAYSRKIKHMTLTLKNDMGRLDTLPVHSEEQCHKPSVRKIEHKKHGSVGNRRLRPEPAPLLRVRKRKRQQRREMQPTRRGPSPARSGTSRSSVLIN